MGGEGVVMRSPCQGAARDLPLWTGVPNKALSYKALSPPPLWTVLVPGYKAPSLSLAPNCASSCAVFVQPGPGLDMPVLRTRTLALKGSNLILLLPLVFLFKIPRTAALAARAPRLSSLLSALHSSADGFKSARCVPSPLSWRVGTCYPASWRLWTKGPRHSLPTIVHPSFRAVVRMSGGASMAVDAEIHAGDEGEKMLLENFANAKTPVINPDVSQYQARLDEKAERVRELLGDYLQVL